MTEQDSSEFVEVMDITVLVAVAGVDGEPAKLHYTVREHQGDLLGEQPGALVIQFGPRDQPDGSRLSGKKVTLSSAQLVGMERESRLERRVRPSVANLVDPRRSLKEKMGAVKP